VPQLLQPIILVSIAGQTGAEARSVLANTTTAFAAVIQTPSLCPLGEGSLLSIVWSVVRADSGVALSTSNRYSNTERSYQIPPFALVAGASYVVTIAVSIQVASSSALTCGCPQGLIQVTLPPTYLP
jgi:hypothetical protein